MVVSAATWSKLVLIVLIFFSGLLGILSPRALNPFGKNISYGNLVSCGVLIAACFVHLLSDASSTLYNAPLPQGKNGPYPWSYLIAGFSFIFMFFFERILIHQLLHNEHNHGSLQDADDEQSKQIMINHNIQFENTSLTRKLSQPRDHHHGDMREHGHDMLALYHQKNYFSAMALLLGLGIHSFLAGLAVGCARVNSEIYMLGIAILSHKYLAAFALGVPLFKSSKSLKFTLCVAILFASLTPGGIVLGLALENSIDSNPWIADIFICIAAGMFLYVAICEVLIPEFSEDKEKETKFYASISLKCQDEESVQQACAAKKDVNREEMKKMMCVLFGYTFMSALAIWV